MKVNTEGWSENNHVVLAVSTGIDSMTLLHQLISHLKHSYAKLTCLHVNHQIRSVASEEEAFIKAFCTTHDIPLYVHHLDLSSVVAKGNSIESEARHARYQWFDEMMLELNADVLLTAHHLDDQIETIFYRLMTGRSTRSSLGMSQHALRGHYSLYRPLLTIAKSEIHNYQKRYQIPYYEDETNAENHYVRNDIRNRILPEIEANQHLSTEQLLKLKEWHDEQLEVIRNEAYQFIDNSIEFCQQNTKILISRSQFLNLRHAVKMAVLDKIFEKVSLDRPITEKTYDEWFKQLAENIAQTTLYTTDKWIIHIAYDKFIIMANYEAKLQPTKINQQGIYNFGHYTIQVTKHVPLDCFPLVVRTRKDGDKFALNGRAGHKKVSRLFIDEKVIQSERDKMPIIVNAHNEIIAIGTLFLKQKYEQLIFIRNTGEEWNYER